MIPTEAITALIAGAVSLVGGWMMARGNRRTAEMERKLPPYEALSNRVTNAEKRAEEQDERIASERERSECLEDRVDGLELQLKTVEHELRHDREWIARAIPALEEHAPALLWLLKPWPEWYVQEVGMEITTTITTTMTTMEPE